MGKTKIKTIDDSAPQEPKKPAKKLGRSDDALVEKLKEELGIKEEKPKGARGDGEEGSRGVAARSEATEDAPRDTEPAGPRAKSRGKKYLEASKDLDRNKFYPLPEALDMVKKTSYTKFNGPGTLEAHINTTQMGIRGLISLPFASGKKIRILAFGKGAENSGASFFGDDSTLDQISKDKIDFDYLKKWAKKLEVSELLDEMIGLIQ